jgi:hypothetical protein
MDTDAVITHSGVLKQHGETLEQAWTAAAAGLSTDEAGIAQDVLGITYRSQYDPDSAAVRAQADRVAPALRASAQVAEQCAYLYRAADQYGRNGMPTPR